MEDHDWWSSECRRWVCELRAACDNRRRWRRHDANEWRHYDYADRDEFWSGVRQRGDCDVRAKRNDVHCCGLYGDDARHDSIVQLCRGCRRWPDVEDNGRRSAECRRWVCELPAACDNRRRWRRHDANEWRYYDYADRDEFWSGVRQCGECDVRAKRNDVHCCGLYGDDARHDSIVQLCRGCRRWPDVEDNGWSSNECRRWVCELPAACDNGRRWRGVDANEWRNDNHAYWGEVWSRESGGSIVWY